MYRIDQSNFAIPKTLPNASKKELFVSSKTNSSNMFLWRLHDDRKI